MEKRCNGTVDDEVRKEEEREGAGVEKRMNGTEREGKKGAIGRERRRPK